MSFYANLNGERVTRGDIEIPYYGAWSADVSHATDTAVSDAVTLSVGGLSLVGTRYRTAPFAGVRTSRLVGGFGGWLKQVPAQAYYNPGGVLLSLLFADLAILTGEKVSVAADTSVGTYFVREAAPAQRIMSQLVGYNWFVGTDGTTQLGATRDGSAIASAFLVEQYDGGTGTARIATENPEDWMPGRAFTNAVLGATQTISSVRHVIRDGVTRVEVLVQSPTNRDYTPWQQLTRETDPGRTFQGLYEYAVQATDGTTADLAITVGGLPVPQQLTSIPLRVGLPGFVATPAVGSAVAVAFLNGDPARPVVLGAFDSTNATLLTYNGGLRVPVCYGDTFTAATGLTANTFPVIGVVTASVVADPIAFVRKLST